MELKPGMSAFVTGGASGIVCIPVGGLAIMGPAFSLLDDTLRELMVMLELQDMHAKFQKVTWVCCGPSQTAYLCATEGYMYLHLCHPFKQRQHTLHMRAFRTHFTT